MIEMQTLTVKPPVCVTENPVGAKAVPPPVVVNQDVWQIALRAVQTVNHHECGPGDGLGRSKAARNEFILTVLVYCYLSQIYSALEIETTILSQLGDVFGEMPLDACFLRRFRRQHHDLVVQCLALGLARAASSGRGACSPPRPEYQKEAEQLLTWAIMIDHEEDDC